MRLEKQQSSLIIPSLDDKVGEIDSKHGTLFPPSIRCLICGPSDCGKTNLMLNILYHPNGLRFENIYLYTKSLQQPKYKRLIQILDPMTDIGLYPFQDNTQIPPPEEAKNNSVFIFDDIACDKQENVRSYFCMGRHSGVDSFYLCQSYTRVPKHLIRDNANFLIIFKQDNLNMKRIYEDHVNSDMDFKMFKYICCECWVKDKYGFLVIDKDRPLNRGRYRKGFDIFIIV